MSYGRKKTQIVVVIIITLSQILTVSCQKNEQTDKTEHTEVINKAIEHKFFLPSESLGIFTGEEPSYSMKFGNQMIPMASSKWHIEISGTSLEMQQVSDGQTIHYTGTYTIQSEDEIKIVIKAQLTDDKYNQSFKPTLRFYKTTNIWFLEGVAGSEGCSLKKL
ncbi:MAG: hypothetical protein QXG00_07685 [Candidatus Woesearchaeota archaeon]